MTEGSHIGHHRLERVLGSGSFATVWLARDERLDSPVAIKVLADNWARNPEVRRRFIDEARLLRRIDDDRVVRVHAVDELPDGRPYFVMAWADRGTLHERLRTPANRDGLPLGEALSVTIDVADCLGVVHAYGVVHRDVKPSNVLFRSLPAHRRDDGRDEALLLADFGLAKDTVAGSGFTLAAGTPAYMAPEQAGGPALLDVRADLYSLTAVLYELLTGVPAFSASSLSGARPGARAAPQPLAERRPDLPADLQEVIDRGLADDPGRRYATARELAAALAAIPGVPRRQPAAGAAVPSSDVGPGGPMGGGGGGAGGRSGGGGGGGGGGGPMGGGRTVRPASTRDPMGGGVEVADVVDAVLGHARSLFPDLAPRWDAAGRALRRPVRVAVSGAVPGVASLASALRGVGGPGEVAVEVAVVAAGGIVPGADVLVVAGSGAGAGDRAAAGPPGDAGVARRVPAGARPVRVLAVGSPDTGAGAGARLDPHRSWPADPDPAAAVAAWLAADLPSWASAARASDALAVVEDTASERRGDPQGRELAGRVELIRLANPVLGDIRALRAEAAGELRWPATERAELRRVLVPGPPAARTGLGAGAGADEIRRVAGERAGQWRGQVNRGRVPFASRWAAEAVARAYDRLASETI